METKEYAPVVCIGAMSKLLARSCASLALSPVFPANALCNRPTRKWPSGADTKNPYSAILKALESIRACARALARGDASLGMGADVRPATLDPMTSCRKENVPVQVGACVFGKYFVGWRTHQTSTPWCVAGLLTAGRGTVPAVGAWALCQRQPRA